MVTNYASFTIDYKHFVGGLKHGAQILGDLKEGKSRTTVEDHLPSYFGQKVGYASTYQLSPTKSAEQERAGLGIYLDSQHHWEQWQGAGWPSPITEGYRGSSYANEDLPSDYLGYYVASRFPSLVNNPEYAAQLVANLLGGGHWTSQDPPHARFLGKGVLPAAGGALTVPLYWGDRWLKNHEDTPRVWLGNGWHNVPWPSYMQISPMGNGTNWQYQSSQNVFIPSWQHR